MMPTAEGTLLVGPEDDGLRMTAEEFDAAEGVEGWRYELINGILIVTSAPPREVRGPNELLGHWLIHYQKTHRQGAALDDTYYEDEVRLGPNRRRADRVIYAGLGRPSTVNDPPTIAVEFVTAGKRNFERDYQDKREEYLALAVKEYWVINRFDRSLTVFISDGESKYSETDVYTTPLLPGFELQLTELFARIDRI